MNKRDSGIQWIGVPVFIVDQNSGEIDIVTNSRDNVEPVFLVGQALFDNIQRDFEPHRIQLDYMIRQFKRGNIEPLNEAARQADAEQDLQ